MARIEWVRHKLENWGSWCQMQDDGGLGYPKQTAFARLGGRGSRAEAVIPVSSIDAAEVDRAVLSLRFTQPHLFHVLTLTYAKGLPRHMVAKQMHRADSTIKRNLEDADHAIARWYAAQDEVRAAARRAA